MTTPSTTEKKADYSVVGRSLPRVEALEKATGRAIYAVDLKLPGMLYGKILRSKFPHARILNIDTSRAQRLPGVKAVVTGKDLPALYGTALVDQPIFSLGKVRYLGEAVAGVAALDEDTAEEALSLIEVDYEELPAVFDPLEAMKPEAPILHEAMDTYQREHFVRPIKGTNICQHFKLRRGDVEKGFAQADFVFEDTFTSQMVQHCTLEPNAAVAQVAPSGKITVWTNTQSPYVNRRELAAALKIPMSKIRVIVTSVGGGFGAKIGPRADSRAVALALKCGNRPVKVAFSRQEEFASAAVRHPTIVRLKTGVMRDGRIVARQVETIWDTGAYAETGPTVCRNAGHTSAGPYNIPHVRIDGYCVYTNKTIAAAFRGYGVPQVTWAYESQMDIIARKLGIDPLEMRLRNGFVEGDLSASGQVLRPVSLKETLYRATAAIEWGKPSPGHNRGKGIACMHKATMTPSSSSAFVKVNEDGTVSVLTSTVDMGQGSNTTLAQIAAEELGVSLDETVVVAPDTDLTPYDMTTSASRSTFHMGNAVRLAAAEVKAQLFQIAAEALEANPADLEARGGRIFVVGAPERGLSISEVIKHRHGARGGPILGKASFTPAGATSMDLETGQGARPSAFWMYATQGAEVEVDAETGKVKVLRMAAAHDVGKAINPLNCEGQIQGALGMGVGCALTEEIITHQGRTLNPSFMDYKVSTAMDIPPVKAMLVESPHYEGPFGAIGLGEPGLAPTAAAIANAVEDAAGIRIKDLPITPEKVLKALQERRE